MDRENKMKKHILVIDDDVPIGDLLEEALMREGYRVIRAYSGTEALLVLAECRPDLVLLDLMLPGLNGEEVLPHLKGIPVIVVSAKVDVDSKVNLLLGGAADYIAKPFEIRELLARIAVQLRGHTFCEEGNQPGLAGKAEPEGKASALTFEDITLDPASHQVTVGERAVRLTRTEYAILKILMINPAQVVAKPVLLDRISGETPDCTETSLKMHVSNLRKKLRDAGGRDYIEAVWGIGFKLRT